MKKLIVIILGFAALLSSCATPLTNMEDLKAIENYSTQNTIVSDPNAMDAEITFVNNESVNTKIQGRKNIFYGTLTETSINQKFKMYDRAGKKHSVSHQLVQKMVLKDYEGKERTFIKRDAEDASLYEVVYDGKIKWFKEYYPHSYDASVQVTNHFVNEENATVQVGNFNSMKKKLKELTASKPELSVEIEKLSNPKEEDIIAVLKAYEN